MRGINMKRLIPLLLFLLLCCSVQADARMNAYIAGSVASTSSCGATSEPAGDIFSDGFQTATTGYEIAGWTETGTVEAAYDISALSPPAESCTQGAQFASSGSVAASVLDLETGSGRTTWVKFALRVQSEGLTFAQNTAIYCPTSNATLGVACPGILQIYEAYNGEGADLKVRVSAATNSATTNTSISLNTWHVVEACFTDQDIGSDPCGAGTNGYGWVRVDGGTIATFQPNNTAADTRYHQFGVMTASRTIDFVLGYVAGDDDGTY